MGAKITEAQRIPGSRQGILSACAKGHLKIPIEDMRNDALRDLREEGLVRCGQEMTGCVCCHMGDHSFIISGVPTLFAWVMITPKGREALNAVPLAQEATAAEMIAFCRSEADVQERAGGLGIAPLIREGYPDLRLMGPAEMRAVADKLEKQGG